MRALLEWLSRAETQAGEPVPLRGLSAQLGMSRTPLRTAIGRLHEQGLVHYHPRLGFTVAMPTVGDLRELFDIRAMFEEHGVRRYLASETKPPLAALIEAADGFAAIVDSVATEPALYHRVRELDAAFHQALVDLASSRRLSVMYGQLHVGIHVTRSGWLRSWGVSRFAESAEEHNGIVQAVRSEDEVVAVQRVRRHIERVEKVVLNSSSLSPVDAHS